MKFFVFALILAMTVSGCNKKKSSSSVSNVGVTPHAGGSSIAGNVQINQICGTNQAQIQLYSYNSQQPLYSASAPIGGTYQFQVAAGSYTLYATAGSSCVVSGPVQAIQGQVKYYDLNISNYGTGTGGYPNQGMPYPCDYQNYGCQGTYPGTGGSVFGKPNIYISGPSQTAFNLKLKFLEGNNLLAAIPAHGTVGWDIVLSENAQLKVQDSNYGYLFYDVQADTNSLQSDRGFCNNSKAIVDDMLEYLKNSGFAGTSLVDFKAEWSNKIPNKSAVICAYPQDNSEIAKIAELETTQAISATRVWFLLVPQMEEAKITNKDQYQKYAKYFKQKPATDALVAIRATPKTRNVASSPDSVTIQEWGVGFLIEK